MNSYPDIMANKKKILFFVQDGVGGAERVSVLFGKSLDMRENEVKFYLIETPERSKYFSLDNTMDRWESILKKVGVYNNEKNI